VVSAAGKEAGAGGAGSKHAGAERDKETLLLGKETAPSEKELLHLLLGAHEKAAAACSSSSSLSFSCVQSQGKADEGKGGEGGTSDGDGGWEDVTEGEDGCRLTEIPTRSWTGGCRRGEGAPSSRQLPEGGVPTRAASAAAAGSARSLSVSGERPVARVKIGQRRVIIGQRSKEKRSATDKARREEDPGKIVDTIAALRRRGLASKIAPGVRICFRWAPAEWYLGTVKSPTTSAGWWHVEWDDKVVEESEREAL